MYHKHELDFRFYSPNKVWVISQPGKDQDIYLYPNGIVRVGYNEEKNTAYNDRLSVPLEFE